MNFLSIFYGRICVITTWSNILQRTRKIKTKRTQYLFCQNKYNCGTCFLEDEHLAKQIWPPLEFMESLNFTYNLILSPSCTLHQASCLLVLFQDCMENSEISSVVYFWRSRLSANLYSIQLPFQDLYIKKKSQDLDGGFNCSHEGYGCSCVRYKHFAITLSHVSPANKSMSWVLKYEYGKLYLLWLHVRRDALSHLLFCKIQVRQGEVPHLWAYILLLGRLKTA